MRFWGFFYHRRAIKKFVILSSKLSFVFPWCIIRSTGKKLNHVLSIYLMLSNGDKRNILFVLCLSVFGFSPNSRQCQSLIHYK